MWLRDALPDDLADTNVLIYGYDSSLAGSTSFEDLEALASTFRIALQTSERPLQRPIVFLAHSLGELIFKEVREAAGSWISHSINRLV
jgi:predicted glycosyl hydrolase (DUF1957 family)